MSDWVYEESYRIPASETDVFGGWKYSAIFSHMQTLGERHAQQLQVGIDMLLQRGVAWVVARVKIEMYRRPRADEVIHLKTWPGTPLKCIFPRYYWFETNDGEELGKAVTVWSLLDLEKREIIIQTAPYVKDYPHVFEGNPLLPVPTHIILDQLEHEVVHQPTYSDLDSNQHVNNARYLEWVFDLLHHKALDPRNPRAVQLNFTHEILHKDRVTLQYVSNEAHFQVQGKDGALVFFTAEVEW